MRFFRYFACVFILIISGAQNIFAQADVCSDLFTQSNTQDQTAPLISLENLPDYFKVFNDSYGGELSRLLSRSITDMSQAREVTSALDLFLLDSAGGIQKLEVLQALGFEINIQERTISGAEASWLEIRNNFERILDEKKVPEEDRLYPTVVLKRINPKTNEVEFKLVDPVRESFPPAEFGFDVTGTNVNLPFKVFFKGLQEGKFPLPSNTHDLIGHIVPFLRFPWLMKAIRKSAEAHGDNIPQPSYKRRLFWVGEFFSLPLVEHTVARGLINEVRAADIRSDTDINYQKLRSDLNSVTDEQLLVYADRLNSIFEKSLLDLSGAAARPDEFADFMRRLFLTYPTQVFLPGTGRSLTRFDFVIEAISTLRDNQPIKRTNIRTNPTSLEVMFFNLKTVAYLHKQLLYILKNETSEGIARLLKNPNASLPYIKLRDLTAMMELAILKFSSEEDLILFVNEMLAENIPPTSNAAKFIRDLFNNDLILPYYFENRRR